MEDPMRFARINTTSVSVGLVVSVLGLGMLLASPADARKATKQQRAYVEQQAAVGTMPRNTWCVGPHAASRVPLCWAPIPIRLSAHSFCAMRVDTSVAAADKDAPN
jgi:hypothetical protein